ncbi:MAG: hypothetical protein J6D03_00385 [Clostridia bacterium]|nr:hypothetical protein [Clostridia bacterium]
MFSSVENLDLWDTLKVSSDSTDQNYQIGGTGEQIFGEPQIKYNYVVFIEKEKLIWNRGTFYCENKGGNNDSGELAGFPTYPQFEENASYSLKLIPNLSNDGWQLIWVKDNE